MPVCFLTIIITIIILSRAGYILSSHFCLKNERSLYDFSFLSCPFLYCSYYSLLFFNTNVLLYSSWGSDIYPGMFGLVYSIWDTQKRLTFKINLPDSNLSKTCSQQFVMSYKKKTLRFLCRLCITIATFTRRPINIISSRKNHTKC